MTSWRTCGDGAGADITARSMSSKLLLSRCGHGRILSVQRCMRTILCLFCIASLGLARAAFLEDYTNPTNGTAVTAGFVPGTLQAMVGEPMFITFTVSNRGAQTFQFSHVRNEIFTITATNAAGFPVKSRYLGLEGNGFMKTEKVAPGQVYTRRIFLNERSIFDQPGDYTVHCRCDFSYF